MDGVIQIVKGIAENVRQNQTVSDKDYRDSEGLLVCGVCGEHKEQWIDLSGIGDGPNQVMKVPCVCKCRKEEMEREKAEKEKREEMERVRKLRKASLIDSKLSEAKFESFEKNKENQIVYKRCWKYATSFDKMLEENCGLLLWGDVGTGKSYTAACIANYLLNQGVSVIMTSFVKLLESYGDGDNETSIINRMKKVKLVIFDDLGAERGTDYALEKVYNIVDSRYRTKLPMILTTNLTLAEMKNEKDLRYSRIYDRIFEVCYPIQFTGASWRKREAYKKFEAMGAFLDE